jgi:hypothetical protein
MCLLGHRLHVYIIVLALAFFKSATIYNGEMFCFGSFLFKPIYINYSLCLNTGKEGKGKRREREEEGERKRKEGERKGKRERERQEGERSGP